MLRSICSVEWTTWLKLPLPSCLIVFCKNVYYCKFQNVLVSPSEDQYELLLRRLKERIQDGGSETIFDIGIAEGQYSGRYLKEKEMYDYCSTYCYVNWKSLN